MQSNDPGLFLHNAPFLQGFLREQDTKSEMKTCPVMTQILHNGSRRPGKVHTTFLLEKPNNCVSTIFTYLNQTKHHYALGPVVRSPIKLILG